MARERVSIDISNDPELIRLTEDARARHASLVLQVGSEDVAILTPTFPRARRTSDKWVTEDDSLFRLIGIGKSGIPGGVSGKKHEAIRRAFTFDQHFAQYGFSVIAPGLQ